MSRDEIAEVLAAHRSDMGDGWCDCGIRLPDLLDHTREAHLAAVLAERERRVKAEVLREAAAACRRMADQAEIDAGGKLERWDAFVEAEDWLRERTDRIEGQS